MGVAHRTYQAWEAGSSRPTYRNLERIARYFGVSERFILTGDEATEPAPLPQLDRIETKLDRLHEALQDIVARVARTEQRITELGDEAMQRALEARPASGSEPQADAQSGRHGRRAGPRPR
jgi:transcriptional regulator with XRE-family HTH domain